MDQKRTSRDAAPLLRSRLWRPPTVARGGRTVYPQWLSCSSPVEKSTGINVAIHLLVKGKRNLISFAIWPSSTISASFVPGKQARERKTLTREREENKIFELT